MSTSHDDSLLNHLAEYMIYLSTASSFWFSLDSSYDHEFHLSKRFGMSPQDYEHLLVAAYLAHFHTKWGFSIKKLKWKLFFECHLFATTNCTGTFEVDVKKLDLNACINGVSPKHRVNSHFIRIGLLHLNSPRNIEMQKDSQGQMMSTPLRLNGLLL
jgi:hypothetical protein